ncbi:hypothetical protein GLOTRDRAFT_121456 [Gloeophyllum trabeum ATCC 11539]|uniref:Uncharacterized protein n=1 Tax=Gloeophyllum trabeum (strain ATCC 11539 / FP-39264 / Madison 617) TaxID=670483 RepID=S7RLF0_GLOTA|nr:uncharacterized protein GLOTRDRAFT_121456 [Gloeophyllum trabeum ATCC 11539]EPQ55230.1 hypothetical protein GLOTRDRAFT_121456 [Gloeophyllum trabeum ATCC 11539]
MTSHPEHIEEIFKRVEEESEKRALEEQSIQQNPQSRPSSSGAVGGRRRGGSVSISRFGEPIEPSQGTESSNSSVTNPAARLSRIASKSNVYQSRLHTASSSRDSFASEHSAGPHEEHAEDDEDDEHITRMQTITGRQTLTKAVGDILARKMSRSRSNSRSMITPSDTGTSAVVIGVSVQQATVQAANDQDDPDAPSAVVLRGQRSRTSLRRNRDSWVQKVTQKFRRKSKSPLQDGQE